MTTCRFCPHPEHTGPCTAVMAQRLDDGAIYAPCMCGLPKTGPVELGSGWAELGHLD